MVTSGRSARNLKSHFPKNGDCKPEFPFHLLEVLGILAGRVEMVH